MNYFDLHCDTAWRCFEEGLSLESELLAINKGQGKDFKKWKQCFAIFIKDNCENPFDYYKNTLADFKAKITKRQENLEPIFTVEGGSAVENDISRAYRFFDDGIKAISLTWNGETLLAGGADTNIGLKPLGKDFIKELNNCNIACDLSHLCKESFFSAIECADKVLATHSCFCALNPHKRNLTDEQLLLIKQKGGIVGICPYPVFLGGDDVFGLFYRHIYHALELGLEKNISIGSDFDGADMSPELSEPDDMVPLYRYLREKGLAEDLLDDLFYANADNFFANL